MDASRFHRAGLVILLMMAGLAVFAATFWLGRHLHHRAEPAPVTLTIDPQLRDDFLSQFSQFAEPEALRFPEVPMTGPDGSPMSLSVGRGEYALVNLWATWCAPCVVELPSLDILADNMKQESIEVMAISIDRGRDLDDLRNFLEMREIGNFALHHDESGKIRSSLPVRGIPTSFLIGEGNQILYILEGDIDWMSPPSRMFFETLASQD